ncbi:MAG: hypothetical protein HC802_07375 [Caldilineaceae bacterium]|nr:hypothetical protein [Caldilineaceae bacterium]
MNPVHRTEPRQIEIVCHKGANEYAPENTYAAAQLCIDWGMDFVEIDVNRSHDGMHYILHGPELDATTNGRGRIDAMLAAEIDQLDAGSWFDPRLPASACRVWSHFCVGFRAKPKCSWM